jgi:hypothetical protein
MKHERIYLHKEPAPGLPFRLYRCFALRSHFTRDWKFPALFRSVFISVFVAANVKQCLPSSQAEQVKSQPHPHQGQSNWPGDAM